VNRADTANIRTHALDVVNSFTALLSCSSSASTSAARSSGVLPAQLLLPVFAVVPVRRVLVSVVRSDMVSLPQPSARR
jgi:hypothetical protein